MNGSRRVLLDPQAENVPPPECVVVQDPVGLVETALEDHPLLVQGEDLCRWAEDFGIGRKWSTTWLASPSQELVDQCPALTAEQAKEIIVGLGSQIFSFNRPFQLRDIIVARLGDNPIWDGVPTPDHAFCWLSWVASTAIGDLDWKLIGQFAQTWQATAEPALQSTYSANSDKDAWALIREWIGILPPKQAWPSPPRFKLNRSLERRLNDDLTKLAIDTETDFFDELLGRAPDTHLLRCAAAACAKVLIAHPEKATSVRIRRLEPYLPYDGRQRLAVIVPPEHPGLPAWEFEQLATWFMRKYLPYRQWSERLSTSSNHDEWTATSSEEFSRQYLRYFAAARIGGSEAQHLAWAASSHLRQDSGNWTQLLVVVDGLTYPDGVRLRSWVREQSPRLFLDAETLVLAPLPTITEFAKPSVAGGMPPSDAIVSTALSIFRSGDLLESALRQAKPGEVLVWALTEPDRTYHYRADDGPVTVRREVEAQLRSIAGHIAHLVEQAPPDQRLRIIITTDHGRLLTTSERKHAVPSGMQAHQRAAWGKHDVRIEAGGFTIEDGLAYLDPGWFGLPEGQGYAVIVSGQTFVTADGRGGKEPFPHGGLFPEEVLIPWIEFTRDREPTKLSAVLRGKGEDGKSGAASLEVSNPGSVVVRLLQLNLPKPEAKIPLDVEIGPLTNSSVQVRLPQWPSKSELANFEASLLYAMPGGEPVRCSVGSELETESLYDRPDILGELGDL